MATKSALKRMMSTAELHEFTLLGWTCPRCKDYFHTGEYDGASLDYQAGKVVRCIRCGVRVRLTEAKP